LECVCCTFSGGAGRCNIPQCLKLSAHPLHHLLSRSYSPTVPLCLLCSCTILSFSNTCSSLFLLPYIDYFLSYTLLTQHHSPVLIYTQYERVTHTHTHTHIGLHTSPNVVTRIVKLCCTKIFQLVIKPSRKTSTCLNESIVI